MISTEKAFDMLPYAVDMVEKLDLQGYGTKMFKELQGKDPDKPTKELQLEVGLAVMSHIVKHLPKVKEEFFQLVAIASDSDVKTAKERPLAESIQVLKEVFLDRELLDFFKGAVR